MTTQPDDQSVDEIRTELESLRERVRQAEASTKQMVPYAVSVPAVVDTTQPTLSERVVRLEAKQEESNTIADRVTQLEKIQGELKETVGRLDTFVGQLASREDFEKAKNSILRWLVGTGIAAAGVLATMLAVLL